MVRQKTPSILITSRWASNTGHICTRSCWRLAACPGSRHSISAANTITTYCAANSRVAVRYNPSRQLLRPPEVAFSNLSCTTRPNLPEIGIARHSYTQRGRKVFRLAWNDTRGSALAGACCVNPRFSAHSMHLSLAAAWAQTVNLLFPLRTIIYLQFEAWQTGF